MSELKEMGIGILQNMAQSNKEMENLGRGSDMEKRVRRSEPGQN